MGISSSAKSNDAECFIYVNKNVLHVQDAQEASRRVSLKKEHSKQEQFKCKQARCQFWMKLYILFHLKCQMRGKVARVQAGDPAILGTPCYSLTSDWSHYSATVVQIFCCTGCGAQMVAMGQND